jgi:hypothetical protein
MSGYSEDICIRHSSDAVDLIDKMIDDLNSTYSDEISNKGRLLDQLEALRDAIEKGII